MRVAPPTLAAMLALLIRTCASEEEDGGGGGGAMVVFPPEEEDKRSISFPSVRWPQEEEEEEEDDVTRAGRSLVPMDPSPPLSLLPLLPLAVPVPAGAAVSERQQSGILQQGSEKRPIGSFPGERRKQEEGGGEEGDNELAVWRQRDQDGSSSNHGLTPSERGCCYRVKVAFTKGRSNGAYKLHPYAFGYYKLEPGSVKGHPHYTSEDGRFALAYCGDSWWVQLASNRGECRGWFHSGWQGNRCVSDIDYTWRFYIPEIDTFIDAGKGLSVWCKS